MRISRKVDASSQAADVNNKYVDAIGHIRSAIDALGEVASSDSLARESIANLSVVLLDLNSSEDNSEE